MVLLAEIRDLLKGLNIKQIITTGMHSLDVIISILTVGYLDPRNLAVPQLDARNAVAWKALGRSHDDIMDPVIDRWKGGLDATLVFVRSSVFLLIALHVTQIGLFSAITTAFFVDSFSRLQPRTDTSAMNDVLANLTNVLLLVHGFQFNTTDLRSNVAFEPDPSDVRENVFWSLSLGLSVSLLFNKGSFILNIT
jgi:hypothetical protein